MLKTINTILMVLGILSWGASSYAQGIHLNPGASSNTQLVTVQDHIYRSPMNFMLSAMSVKNLVNDNKIEVVLSDAVLYHPDNSRFNAVGLMEQLQRVFDMEEATGVKITFPMEACRAKDPSVPPVNGAPGQLLECNNLSTQSGTSLQGVQVDWNGHVTATSVVELQARSAWVQISQVTRETIRRTETFLQVQVSVQIPGGHIPMDPVFINNTKSKIQAM